MIRLFNRFPADRAPERYDRVCIVQVGDRHTELLGYFLWHFADSEVDLVHRYESSYSYIGYFERGLARRFARILREYDYRARYDLVVLLTSNEAPIFRVTARKRLKRLLDSMGVLAPFMKAWMAAKERRAKARPAIVDGTRADDDRPLELPFRSTLFRNARQTVAVCHLRDNLAPDCRNVALTPLVKQLPWFLPVLPALPMRDPEARTPTICCMGLLEERYYQIIPAMARAMPDTTFRLFVRQTNPDCMAELAPLANVEVAVGVGTEPMMETLASSRFLLILDHETSRYRQDRLSGAIPFGLNLAVPMVMSRQLARLYDIRAGVVTYDDTPDTAFVQRLAAIDAGDYRRLVDEARAERERLSQEAKLRFDAFLRATG